MTNKPKKWFVIEKAEISHYLFAASPIQSFTDKMEIIGFPTVNYGGSEYIGEKANYIFPRNIWLDNAKKYLKIVIHDPAKLEKINTDIEKYSHDMIDFGKKLILKNYQNLNNEELGNLYEKFEYLHNQSHFRRGVMWVMEVPGEMFSKYIINLLSREIKKQKLKLQPEVVFAVLATPLKKNQAASEQQEFLKIILDLKKRNKISDVDISEQLRDHFKKYCWLPYGITGPAWDEKYFIKEAKILLKNSTDQLFEKYNFILNQTDHVQKKQEQYLSDLKLDKKALRLIELARESIYIKGSSKEALFYGYFAADKLLKEIGSRLDIDINLVRRMLPWNIKKSLLAGKVDKEELEKRYVYSIQYSNNGQTNIYTGDDSRKFIKSINLEVEKGVDRNLKKLKGSCAQIGKAKGVVKVINNPGELNKMNEGDILVSQMTDPEIVAAMKKAAAIVTDLGGITCHAAIVARELGIPCIIGTKYATKIFEDGDRVEVNADKGLVRKI